MAGLNAKQSLFIEEYLKDFNATQAAIRAGYSKHSAGSKGHELLKNTEIAERVTFAIERRTHRVKFDAQKLLEMSIEVLEVAHQQALETKEPQAIMAFRSQADLVGKHVDVQAWREQLDVAITNPHEVLEQANRRLEDLRNVVDNQ